uniref:Uncharacterized protein n=1 Tax=Rhizophora mucronata TaxID=61149 RepID=A0A2P2Q8T7_RHIMU
MDCQRSGGYYGLKGKDKVNGDEVEVTCNRGTRRNWISSSLN